MDQLKDCWKQAARGCTGHKKGRQPTRGGGARAPRRLVMRSPRGLLKAVAGYARVSLSGDVAVESIARQFDATSSGGGERTRLLDQVPTYKQ